MSGTPEAIDLILYAKSLGKEIHFEIDDFLFDEEYYPQPLASYGGAITKAEYMGLQRGATYFRTVMSLFDSFIVSTEPLKEQVSRIFGPDVWVHVHRNGLDSVLTDISAGQLCRTDEKLRIFYGSGTKAHNEDFETLVAPALVTLLKRYPEVEFVCVGYLNLPASFKAVMDQVNLIPLITD